MHPTGPLASRTNTDVTPRSPKSIIGLSQHGYECFKTDQDSYISYKLLDMWAKFPNFAEVYQKHLLQQMARDRLMIGWNGTHAGTNTDLASYPLLQDVNVGWLQKIREDKPAHVVSGVKVSGDANATNPDFKTLDAMILDAKTVLADWYQNSSDLVVITASDLVSDKYVSVANTVDKPTEYNALPSLLSNKTLGNLTAITPSFFPDRSVLVTSINNLSHYYQNTSRRRSIVEQPESDRVVDFSSINECYVVEDYDKCVLIEGIQLWDEVGNTWS